ncbi:FxLYD domain-containing protein [Micromonospora sp. NPDC048909]|uniref:FxLYD domain-containing protein n=1 Tax=Micromonospora sp. NPDC048909 TaxID=3155643 RepID=UPI003410357F
MTTPPQPPPPPGLPPHHPAVSAPGYYPPPAPPGQPPYPPVSGPPGYYPPPAPPGQPPYPPASGPPGYYPPPPPPPRKKHFLATPGGIFLVVFGTVALMGAICVGLVTVGRVSDNNAVKQLDVQVTACSGTSSVATIGYTVTNNGNEDRRVTLKVEYRDASGARLDTDTAYVGSVPAGDTVRGEESTILNASTSGTITCKIVDVS